MKTSYGGPISGLGGGLGGTFSGAPSKAWEFKKKYISDGVLQDTLSVDGSEKGEEKIGGSSSTMSKEDEHYEEN